LGTWRAPGMIMTCVSPMRYHANFGRPVLSGSRPSLPPRQVPKVVLEAKMALADGCAVVIGLQVRHTLLRALASGPTACACGPRHWRGGTRRGCKLWATPVAGRQMLCTSVERTHSATPRGAVDRRGGRGRDAAQRGRPVRLGVHHARAAAPLRGRALPHAPRGARLRRQGCAARACAPPLMGSLSPHALAPRRPGPACPPAAGGRAGRLSAAL